MGGSTVPTAAAAAHSARRGGPVCPVMIGRADLMELAQRRLREAAAGSGELLLLAGEAGIGKTRLLGEIADRAAATGFAVVRAGAFPGDGEVVGGVLTDLAADLRRHPRLADAGGQITSRLADVDPSPAWRAVVTGLAETIGDLGAADTPVLVAMEDLQWADDLTLEVIGRLAQRLGSRPVLVVGTYRSDELYPRVPMRSWRTRLLTQRLAEEVRLSRLGRDDTAAMVAAIAASIVPTALTRLVVERSDGIPLHVEEFLASIVEADPRSVLPDTLSDAVLARAQGLSPAARELAGAASVIGRLFDLDLLTVVTGEAPPALDEGLRELADRFFVQPSGDGACWDFRHALIRDALYADLTPHRRRHLHARAADAAAAAGFGDAFVSDQYERAQRRPEAYRHARAGAADAVAKSAHREAVELLSRARRTAPRDLSDRERAQMLSALGAELATIDDNEAADEVYTEALAVLRRLGDDGAIAALTPAVVATRHLLGADLVERTTQLRLALSLLDQAGSTGTAPGQGLDTRVRLHAALSAAYMLDRRLDEAAEDGERARTLAVQLDDQTIRWDIDATLGSVFLFAGRTEDGWARLATAVAEATAAGAEAEAARAYRMVGSCGSVLVEYDRALHWLRDGIAYTERTERLNDRYYMGAQLGHVLWCVGQWPEAERESRTALVDGRCSVTTRITALHALGFLALGRGDWAGAEAHLSEAAELGGQMSELQRMSPAWWGLAEVALHSGRPAQAVEWGRRALAASAAVGDAAYLFPHVLTGIRAYLGVGDRAGAEVWAQQCLDLVRHRDIPGIRPVVEHAAGLLALHDGQVGQAADLLGQAAAGWNSRRRFWEGTQATLDLARCAGDARRAGEARTLATQARERAATVGAAALVELADRLLAAQSDAGPVAAGPGLTVRDLGVKAGGSAPLTAREVEVAALIGTGATNREIAATLFIAPKTVAAHVEHILRKLGVARRAQIATWAASRGSPDGATADGVRAGRRG